MRNTIFIGAVAVALGAGGAPLAAQADIPSTEVLAERQAIVESWPAPQQASYERLPSDLREYFWTLPAMQWEAFWILSQEQVRGIMRLRPEEQEQVWREIEYKLATLDPSEFEGRPTITYTIPNNYGPPPASALNRDYPVCGGDIQDECISPGEAEDAGEPGS
ncbi:hypothetical protein FHS61_001775 [Altererythrobacter atlanticus]|uniref:Uncharacterized protein n=1 Tax=Croceibacterium atlanticum TaxID=1267766 RepID=A0A0F7KL12_9SPHN|nr:hypothetical protein [Croceibacterium atlanticum]AKH41248.1 hypothetical protein WYH_00183 [Croceibacterium atlanticum]MBB5732766.1 hypothetical protein [Croceibacterium atlanticum]